MEESQSNPVNDIPPQNPIPNSTPPPIPIPIPPENPSPSPPPPPPAAEPAPMPPPPSTAPVSMPPPPAAAPLSVPPPAPTTVPPPPRTNKRQLDGIAQIQDSSYYKIRGVLKDIRPHLLEVIGTADFRNCKAADELRERLKLLQQLYEQMTNEAVNLKKCKNEPGFSSENGSAQKSEQLQDVKNAADMKEAIDLEELPSYTGGSAFGWNFVTFTGSKAVYYGRTKESYRASQAALASASASASAS